MKGWSGFRRYGRYFVLFSTLLQWSFDNLAIYTGLWEHQKTFAIQVRSPVLSNVPIALHPVKNPLGHSNYFIESSTNQEKLQYRAFGCIGILKDMLLWSWIPVIIEARYHFMSSRDIMDVSDVSLICTWPMKQSYPTEKQSYEKKHLFPGPFQWPGAKSDDSHICKCVQHSP